MEVGASDEFGFSEALFLAEKTSTSSKTESPRWETYVDRLPFSNTFKIRRLIRSGRRSYWKKRKPSAAAAPGRGALERCCALTLWRTRRTYITRCLPASQSRERTAHFRIASIDNRVIYVRGCA